MPMSSARYGCGYVAGELEQRGLAVFVGSDADRDELGPDVLSGQVATGVAAGEEPSGLAGGVEAFASVIDMLANQIVEDGRHLDRNRAESDVQGPVVGDGDLTRSHRHNARKGLSEKQSE